jgi:hypothetical protein
MILLQILAWIVFIVFALFIIIILTPMRYDFCVFLQEKISGKISVGAGPFQVCFNLTTNSENSFSLQLAGITLLEKSLTENTGSRKKPSFPQEKKQKKKDSILETKSQRKGRDVVELLDRELFQAILKTVRDILSHSLPKTKKFEGVWGFANPYHTGILAALKATISGIHVVPDFSGEVRDLRLIAQGRIRPAVLLFYSLRFIVSKPARPILKNLLLSRGKRLSFRQQSVNLSI